MNLLDRTPVNSITSTARCFTPRDASFASPASFLTQRVETSASPARSFTPRIEASASSTFTPRTKVFLLISTLLFLNVLTGLNPAFAQGIEVSNRGFGSGPSGFTISLFDHRFDQNTSITIVAVAVSLFISAGLYQRVVLRQCNCFCGPAKCECACGCNNRCPCSRRDKSAHNDHARHTHWN